MAVTFDVVKNPNEFRPLAFDWKQELKSEDDTLSDTVSVEVVGEDQALVVSNVQVSGSQVRFAVSGGNIKTYKLLCKVETSKGWRYEELGLLKVQATK